MSVDMTVPEAREQRNNLVTNTDVLDKVKALILMPDGVHAMADQVAHYFEVPVETIKSVVKYNRDEIGSDGYRVVRGEELRLNFNPSSLGLDLRTPSLALFPRRAILRVAMLLRDSPIARRIRDLLLDVEAGATHRGVQPLSGLEYALALVEAEKRVLAAEARAEEGAQFKRAIEGGEGLGLRTFHKKYFSAVRDSDFFAHLYGRHYILDQRGKGSLRTEGPKAGTYRNGSQHMHPTYKGKPWLYLHTPQIRTGFRREETRVRPGRYELDFRDRLAADGLTANENSHGVFAIEGSLFREIDA